MFAFVVQEDFGEWVSSETNADLIVIMGLGRKKSVRVLPGYVASAVLGVWKQNISSHFLSPPFFFCLPALMWTQTN